MLSGVPPSRAIELERIEDRFSFLYLEHAVIARDENALTARTAQGVMHIPVAGLLVLLLGPGTSVTHQAMAVLADSGASLVWVGEEGVRYYASGRPLARSTRFLELQAEIVVSAHKRMKAARYMYGMRFPGENLSGLSMQQLRGREGARVRNVYRQISADTGVPWSGRHYDKDNFSAGDPINRALSAANACLYGVTHAAVAALGCAPGLGVIHTGHDRSFVFDIADLYKAEIAIPAAFECVRDFSAGQTASVGKRTLESLVRMRMRDLIKERKILQRIVFDVQNMLLECAGVPEQGAIEQGTQEMGESLLLWGPSGQVEAGTNFGDDKQ